jgi:hypothetical protein
LIRFGALIQFITIISLVIQSILIPYLIGLDSYGMAIFVLTPVLLIASIFEPLTQHFYISNKKSYRDDNILTYLFYFIIAIFLVQTIFFFFLSDFLAILYVLSLFLGVFFILSILVQAYSYSISKLKNIFIAHFIGLTVGLIYILFAYNLNFEGSIIYMSFFVLYQATVFIVLFKSNLAFFKTLLIDLEKTILKKIDFSLIIESLNWRIFFILYSLVFIWMVGFFYEMSVVGELKLVFTLLLGLRYLYPINTPMFHKLAHTDYKKAISILIIMLFVYYSLSFLLYFVGYFFIEFFNLNDLYFLFSYKYFFYSFPILLTSLAIGSIFSIYNKYTNILVSIILFIFTLVAVMMDYKIDIIFLIISVVYLVLFVGFIIFKDGYVYSR